LVGGKESYPGGFPISDGVQAGFVGVPQGLILLWGVH